ncbi:MAG TPA: amidohydrolase [Planctomycetota bacterium]|jgi:hippurate hydrolase|nr:amidohydrolase [Planctomycetota bacterium]
MRILPALLLLVGCQATVPAPSLLAPSFDDELNGPVKDAVGAEIASLVGLYTWFHTNAEVSLKEEKTSAKFASEVREAGWTVTEKIGGYGVVAVLKNGTGPTILLRIDMDGLPVKEETGLPYASMSGAMHACGHDSHLAMGIGVARLLSRLQDRWAGTVILVGQPAEEVVRGARMMLEDPKFNEAIPSSPVACLSVHDFPGLAGTVGVCPGFASANTDSLDLTIFGHGGHGAWPQKTVDPIVIGSELVMSLQTIVSRKLAPGTRAVVTVGSFHSGTKHNIIPNDAKLQLTVRSYEADVREKLLSEIKHIAEAVAEVHHAPKKPELTLVDSCPAGYHDPVLSERMIGVFQRLLGKDKVTREEPVMGGEDFGLFAKHFGVPGLQFRVGGAKPNHDPEVGLHSSKWAVDPEPTLRTGTAAFARACLELLGKK